MEYMFIEGFLGTRAPFFMDIVTLIVAALPFLLAIVVAMARFEFHKTHIFLQYLLLIVSVVVLVYFEYGVRLDGGFENYVQKSGVGIGYITTVLIAHIITAVATLVYWIMTMVNARRDRKYKGLPGVYSASHKQAGIKTFILITLTSLSGIWVYFLLFVY